MIKISTIISFINRIMIVTILTLIVLILVKSNSNFKNIIYKKLYIDNFSFNKINQIYNKYIGNNDILKKYIKSNTVASIKNDYSNNRKYLDGVEINYGSDEVINADESGVVVFIGNKDGYNKTIIIQRIDGIDEWYGNIENTNLKMYDYVNKGDIVGNVLDKLYLVFKKDEKILEYEKYIK